MVHGYVSDRTVLWHDYVTVLWCARALVNAGCGQRRFVTSGRSAGHTAAVVVQHLWGIV